MCCCVKDINLYWKIVSKITKQIPISKKEYNFLMRNNFPFKEVLVEE